MFFFIILAPGFNKSREILFVGCDSAERVASMMRDDASSPLAVNQVSEQSSFTFRHTHSDRK